MHAARPRRKWGGAVSGGLAEEKNALRKQLMASRAASFSAAQSDGKVVQANEHLLGLLAHQYRAELSGVILSGYMAMRSEIDPAPAMAAHAGPVCVPVVTGAKQPLEFHRWSVDCDMVPGAFKALIPAQRDPLIPQALIVPMLAFDRQGYRLGYGGGFYDRTLAQLRMQGPVFAIGFAFAEQFCNELPREATDQPLDAIVTPDGVFWPE